MSKRPTEPRRGAEPRRRAEPQRSTLAAVLRDVLRRTTTTLYGDRAALYIVQLTDEEGFALAERRSSQPAHRHPAWRHRQPRPLQCHPRRPT